MARLPNVTDPSVTGFSKLRVGPLRQAPPSDTTHQVLQGTSISVINASVISLTVAAIAANTAVEQTFVLTGNLSTLKTTDVVFVHCSGVIPAGVVIGNQRVSATGTLKVQFANVTAGSITPGALAFNLLTLRS